MLSDTNTSTLIIVFVCLVIAITLHEAMHAFTGHWLGDDTAQREGRISLNPLRHIDLFGTVILPFLTLVLFKFPLLAAKPVPFNPNRVKYEEFGAAMVGIAGPLTNLFLACIGAVFVNLTLGTVTVGVLDAVVIFVQLNIALFVFNMIPIPPLDGSRLLYAFAPEPLQAIMAQLENYGFFIIIALLVSVPAFSDLLIHLNRSVTHLLLPGII